MRRWYEQLVESEDELLVLLKVRMKSSFSVALSFAPWYNIRIPSVIQESI